jgi:opacity protein-like surface antigen
MKQILKGFGAVILILTLVGLVTIPANAQTQSTRRFKTDMIFDLDFSTLKPDGAEGDLDVNTFSIAFDLGYFITDMFELGPEILYKKYELDESGDSLEISTWSLFVKGNAHFSANDDFKPYAGLRLGFSSLDIMDTDDTALSYGVQIGFDYFISENVSVNPELRYTMTSYEFEGLDVDMDGINFMIGFGIFF